MSFTTGDANTSEPMKHGAPHGKLTHGKLVQIRLHLMKIKHCQWANVRFPRRTARDVFYSVSFLSSAGQTEQWVQSKPALQQELLSVGQICDGKPGEAGLFWVSSWFNMSLHRQCPSAKKSFSRAVESSGGHIYILCLYSDYVHPVVQARDGTV